VSLLKKTLLIILLCMAVFLSAMLAVSRTLLMGGYQELEQESMVQNVERVKNALMREIGTLKLVVLDWAPWDDTYTFAENRNEDFIAANLQPSTLDNLRITVLALLPRDDGAVFQCEGTGEHRAEAFSYLEKNRYILSKSATTDGIAGLFTENGVIGFVAAAPVLRSDGSGPALGTLVFIRMLDHDDLAMLSESTLVDFSAFPLSSLSGELRATALDLMRGNEEISTDFRSKKLAVGHTILPNIENMPSVLLEIRIPRDIHLQGERTIRIFLFWLILFGLFITAVLLLLLKKNVIDRLLAARDCLDGIARNGAIRERVPLSGNDELTTLSASVNSVLDSFEGLVENLPDPLFITEESEALEHVNREARSSLQYSKSELLGQPLSLLLSGDMHHIGRHEGDSPVLEGMLVRKDGGTIPVELHSRSFLLGEKKITLTAARDLTERKALEESLKKTAYFDMATGLPNRPRFLQILDELLVSGHAPFTVILLDLDRFRTINNMVGTNNGDQVLALVGRRIAQSLAPGDCLSRFGGDEFAALVKGRNDWESIAPVVRRIKENATQPVSVEQHSIFPSVGMGVYLHVPGPATSAVVIAKTEIALSKAKDKGIGQFAVFSEDDSAEADILTAEQELRQALKNGEFVLHYQPLYRLKDMSLSGFEALIRWNHPKRGLVFPGGFIPVAEETGLIVDIDRWVAARACQEIALWEHALPERRGTLFISVNSSGRTFREGNYPAHVLEAIRETGVAPASLMVEVTEGVLIRNPQDTAEQLARLRNGGVPIALDDFGTGYSSLQYMNSLPLDKIKIDRSFIQSMLSGEEHRRLVKGMLALSGDLGMETVAEGIENEEELRWLTANGAVFGQGYYLGRPEGAEQAFEKLRKGAIRSQGL
jgi:diguanylate cyclase (GGDEF)-like protein/PAS domain S-box-containing protein